MPRLLGLSLLCCVLPLALGCGKPLRMEGLGRVQAAVLTDAAGLVPETRDRARPPVRITDPDRIAALDAWMKANRGRWHKASGAPRPTRFQLELIGDGAPLYTLWLDDGYAMLSAGNAKPRETRLTNAESAELLACLGLPPDYLASVEPLGPDLGPPRHGVVKGPKKAL